LPDAFLSGFGQRIGVGPDAWLSQGKRRWHRCLEQDSCCEFGGGAVDNGVIGIGDKFSNGLSADTD
jgi:hypothetical protein